MSIESWDEIRTAWQVARAGTVSGAAEILGVHHATVIRHIDALEARLGVKLFQRHARGYTPTEAGNALAQVGRVTDEQFAQLGTRLTGVGTGIEGDLVITTLPGIVPLLRPALLTLNKTYPDLVLRVKTERRVLRLEYGEAHVALRAGNRPTEPDNVVQPLLTCPVSLYASPAYLEEHGRPADVSELQHHRFVAEELDDNRAPFAQWFARLDPAPHVVFRSNEAEARRVAIADGLGLGFLFGEEDAEDLVQVMPSRPEWDFTIWLVTHVDLHRTPKVQAAVSVIKQAFKQ
ncbi:LysR family transcriptional regulator [Pararhodobacter marinus]|uniref:LysR family transcriptional regulator n=1 Tax=Pararhodobacter marinus TaxID=2184063 RepID=A0A2U2C759_9RHOB|nr:LysR family transcriptional regulator [Pararhodobacter marinus]PWE27726.1 LysR family transcriptional regulator [Pararhodobacter marinus]